MMLSDIDRVHQIESICFSAPWSKASIRSECENTNAHWRVMELGGEIIAYAGMWIIFDESHVTNVAVLPRYRRCGCGEAIMLDMFSKALENGATRMTLEVRASNLPAQSLYRKLGFFRAGIRKGYYPDGEDAWLFWNEDIKKYV